MKEKQDHLKQKANKWEDFRKRRAALIEKYLAVKRRQRSAELIVRHLFLQQYITWARSTIPMTRDFRRNQMLMAVVKIKLILGFSRGLKKHRGYGYKQVSKLRSMFTFYSQVVDGEGEGNAHAQAKGLVKHALRSQDNYGEFSAKMAKMFDLIYFMQKKFQGRIISKVSKAELIDDMWFRLLDEVRERALKAQREGGANDLPPRMLDIVEAIDAVP